MRSSREEDLIAQLNKLSVVAGDQDKSPAHITKKVSSLTFAQKLELVAMHSYCFEGEVSQETSPSKGEVSGQCRQRAGSLPTLIKLGDDKLGEGEKLKVISTRPVGPSAFITVCESKDCRDKALLSRVAHLRFYSWTSSKRSLLFFASPLLLSPLQLKTPEPQFCGIHPSIDLKVVTLDIERDEGEQRLCRLQLPIRFLDLPDLKEGDKFQAPNTGHPTAGDPFKPSSSSQPAAPQASSRGCTSPVSPPSAAPESDFRARTADFTFGNQTSGNLPLAIVPFTQGPYSTYQSVHSSGPIFSEVPPAPITIEVTDKVEVIPDRDQVNSEADKRSVGPSLRSILAAKRRGAFPKGFLLVVPNEVTRRTLKTRSVATPREERALLMEDWRAVSHRIISARVVINKVKIPIVNIYSPVEAELRGGFWEELACTFDPKKFLFLGDWNVVEDPSDSSSRSNWLSRQETVQFLMFKSRFNVLDARSCGGELLGPKFTRFQLRDGRPVWSILDRMYLPLSFLGGFGLKIWDRNKGNSKLDTPETFFSAWLEIRGVIKNAQYEESQLLSTLNCKKKQLANLAKSGTSLLHEFGVLADEVKRLEALKEYKLRL
ncbi:hypothetical protein R1sor_014877 [Riccia sorocarpa]|uniref:Endonuclease/exonuclease/phosphatase domain-containing protein n=1 Tax=Riccia sorocarpa TaxID=122646 RepID=A0ABD3HB42_9MARC